MGPRYSGRNAAASAAASAGANTVADRPAARWGGRAAVAAAATATVLEHVPLSVFPIARDQGLWLTAAQALRDGRVFFVDFLQFHLPGTAVAYRLGLALVDDPRHVPALVAAVSAALTVIALHLLLAATVSRAAGVIAALAFGLLWPLGLGWWGIAQKDFLAVPWLLLATASAAGAGPGAPWRTARLIASGALVAVAIQFKPTAGVAAALLAIGTGWRAWSAAPPGRRAARASADLAALVAGGVAAALPLLVYLVAHHALADAWISVTGLGGEYAAHGRRPLRVLTRFVRQIRGTFPGQSIPAGMLIAAALGGGVAWLSWRGAARRFWLAVPVVSTVGTYFAQGKGIGYHAHPSQVMMFLFVGVAVAWTLKPERLRPIRAASILSGALLLAVLVAFGHCLHYGMTKSRYATVELPAFAGRTPRATYLDRSYSHRRDFPNPAISEDLGRWLRARTTRAESILVWGHECQIYVLADRRYATQAPFDQILASMKPTGRTGKWLTGQRRRFLKLLDRDAPKYIVIATRDENPVEDLPSDKSMKNVPGFPEYLARHYRFARAFERLRVYERRSAPPESVAGG
jgi:hypothetical protein